MFRPPSLSGPSALLKVFKNFWAEWDSMHLLVTQTWVTACWLRCDLAGQGLYLSALQWKQSQFRCGSSAKHSAIKTQVANLFFFTCTQLLIKPKAMWELHRWLLFQCNFPLLYWFFTFFCSILFFQDLFVEFFIKGNAERSSFFQAIVRADCSWISPGGGGQVVKQRHLFLTFSAQPQLLPSFCSPPPEHHVDNMTPALSSRGVCLCVIVSSKSNPPNWGLIPAKRGLYLY